MPGGGWPAPGDCRVPATDYPLSDCLTSLPKPLRVTIHQIFEFGDACTIDGKTLLYARLDQIQVQSDIRYVACEKE